MPAYAGRGTAVDRAGGSLRLHHLAEALVGTSWSIRILDTGAALRIVVDSFPPTVQAGDQYVEVSPTEHELWTVRLSSSAAVRRDQEAQALEDQVALWPILRAEVARLEREAIPELVKRALDGDR